MLGLLAKYQRQVEFFAPDAVFREAREHLPRILEGIKIRAAPALATLDSLAMSIHTIELETYAGLESISRTRLAGRDEDDWPILATALTLRCPIWTEDTGFFGCGVATWTTDRVELFLFGVSFRFRWALTQIEFVVC